MNSYIIWLTSGNCMEGIACAKELLDLKNSYIKFKCAGGDCLCEFEDEDGDNIIDFKEVQAISINNCIKEKVVGYKA
jgi:hypothetical protein